MALSQLASGMGSWIGVWGIAEDPGGSGSNESACNAGKPGSIPESGRCPGGGNGNPLHYSCLEISIDRGAWRTTVPGVTKSWTWLNYWIHMHRHSHMYTHVKPSPQSGWWTYPSYPQIFSCPIVIPLSFPSLLSPSLSSYWSAFCQYRLVCILLKFI